jgi:hypothetical protein
MLPCAPDAKGLSGLRPPPRDFRERGAFHETRARKTCSRGSENRERGLSWLPTRHTLKGMTLNPRRHTPFEQSRVIQRDFARYLECGVLGYPQQGSCPSYTFAATAPFGIYGG